MNHIIDDEIIDAIKSRFFNLKTGRVDNAWFTPLPPLYDWTPKLVNEQGERHRIHDRTNAVLARLECPQHIGTINLEILPFLATFCFNSIQKDRAFQYRQGMVKVVPDNFSTVIKKISASHTPSSEVREEFLKSYSWLAIVGSPHYQGYCPKIYFNTAKLEEDVEVAEQELRGIAYKEYRKAAWVLHETSHLILHWKKYFETQGSVSLVSLKEFLVSMKKNALGKILEKEAWDGAVQLLMVLRDCNLINDFIGDEGSKRFDGIVKHIFRSYQDDDVEAVL